MSSHTHSTHPAMIARLKRARGHLGKVIDMLDEGAPCVDIAQQLFAVEKALTNAKRTLIHDHLDHCLDSAEAPDLAEFKEITKYL